MMNVYDAGGVRSVPSLERHATRRADRSVVCNASLSCPAIPLICVHDNLPDRSLKVPFIFHHLFRNQAGSPRFNVQVCRLGYAVIRL